jgi:ribonuclease G
MSSKELVISQSRHETKIGVLEDGQLVEVYFQRANEYSLAGSIHKGRVTRVLPGMQSAFVDLGLERDCFLYVSDFFDEHGDEFDKVSEDRKPDRGRDRDRERNRQREPEPPQTAPPARAGAEPGEDEEGSAEGEALSPPAGEAAGGAEAADSRDRRGRRPRRRRRGGRGFPDSKYASPEAAAEEAEPAPEEPADEEIILLPGESLAKYRRAPEAGEPAGLPPELPEAAYAEAAEDAAEAILDRVDTLEFPAPEDAGGSPPEAPSAEAEASGGQEIAGTGAEEPEASGDLDPAGMPPSLTATLRAQGGRLPHRMPRRMRRRRGGPHGAPAAETGEARLESPPERAELRAPEPAEAQAQDRTERRERERPPLPSISELLKEGQEIIVQIAKEPLGQKGARITSHIALPGRYVVYMPTVEHLGVSRKIASDEERHRLKRILQRHREGVAGGFIMRTAGEGRSEEDIAADVQYLANLWLEIRAKADKRRAPVLLHHDVEIVQRILRDQLTEGFKAVWVDNEDLYEQVLHSVERMSPALLPRVKLYTRPEPIFDAFGITQELEKALRPKVWLKSGGYIVVNQTEALVAIDINTGKFVGKSNRLEDTIVKTNLEAVKEIVRQIRLRDLGGIIVIDFIDMDERKNRQKIMQALEDTMRADKAPYKILQFNDFGLVAITRKRVKQSLERALCAPCPYCEGAGYVKSVQTVVGEILAQAQKYAKAVDGKEVVLRVNPEVAKTVRSVQNKYLEELEEVLGRPVLVVSDPELHREKFDLT